jgi:ADP-heptose:LPS heptosyltransferase
MLIFHQGALGDFIVTFPILQALKTVYSRIDGICRTSFGHLAVDLGVLDAFHPLESARFATLYTENVDPRVGKLVSAYGTVLLFSFSKFIEKSARKIDGPRVCRILPWPHEPQKIHITEFLVRQILGRVLQADAACRQFLQTLAALEGGARRRPGPGARVIISPGAGGVRKRWPLAGFLKVAAELTSLGLRPQILLGPAENDLAEALSGGPQPVAPILATRTFGDLIGALESAGYYIGNDSGVSHLAAFLGLSTLVVFGPSDPDRWRPFGRHVYTIRSASHGGFDMTEDGRDCCEYACLRDITPQRVLTVFTSMLDSADESQT